MKKALVSIALAVLIVPLSAEASWWNPRTWKKIPSEKSEKIATSTEALATSSTPTVDDLYKRIAELETKLEKAQAKLRESESKEKKAEPAPVLKQTEKPVAGNRDAAFKAKSAIVLVETATTSVSGAVIDSKGRVLVNARALLTKNSNGDVIGTADKAKVTLSSGSKRDARLLGFDEARDIAVLEILGEGPFSFVSVTYDAGIKEGDKAYVLGMPSPNGGSGGSSFVEGVVAKKSANYVEATTEAKPLDNGGAMLNAQGKLIGIPNASSCKVLEEGSKCLKYTVGTNISQTQLVKVLEGMRLLKDKKGGTDEEKLVRGALDGVYKNTLDSVVLDYAITSVTGKNSFDLFNERLANDLDGKITKLYLNKLKLAADSIYKGIDFLKTQSHGLNVFFINESANIDEMDAYQKKVLKNLQEENVKKLAEYQAKVSEWSAKKNEYDAYLTHPSDATHDYLMTEGVFVEDAASYLFGEKKKTLDIYSGETVHIF